MSDVYNPFDWYWICANHADSVFSSGKPGWISTSDDAYSNWLKRGNKPTGGDFLRTWELADVLLKAGVPNSVVASVGPGDFGEFLTNDEKLAIVQAVGAQVTSSSKSALNAIYELSGRSWQDMRDEAQYISTYGSFSGGETSLVWSARDKTVAFDTTSDFLLVTRGMADYLTQWKRYLASGGTEPTLGQVTIT